MMIIIIASENQGKLTCIAFERRNFKRSDAYIDFCFFMQKKKVTYYNLTFTCLRDSVKM